MINKVFKKLLIILIFSLYFSISHTQAIMAEEISIIVNSENNLVPNLNVHAIKKIYLGKTHFWGSIQISPFLMKENSTTTKAFLNTVLGLKINKYKTYWLKKLFAEGAQIPPMLKNAGDVIDAVSANKGGIGFVPKGSAAGKSGIKVIATVDVK